MYKNTFLFLFFLAIVISGKAQEKYIADVKLQGNKNLKSSFILLISDAKPGAKLDSLILDHDIIRLKRLPAVAHAYYQVFHSADNSYNVFYNIEESFTINPQLNIYTTNDDEVAVRAGLYDYNTLGRNIVFGGFYQKDNFDSVGINLRAPFVFNNKIGLAINFQSLTTQEPVFLDEGVADYRYNNTSFEVLGLYQFNFMHRIETGVTVFNESYDYLFGATNPAVPTSFQVDKFLFKGIYEYDNLDYYYQYTQGFKSTVNVQYVIANDQTLPDFVIWWNDFQYFLRVGEKGNWANRLRLGLATNANSPFAPFSVDNNLNIRGVGNTIDRGTGVAVLNTEFRYTIFDMNSFVFQGNAFIDAGSWRNPGGDLGDFGKDQNIRVYPGIGFRLSHKRIFNAVLRVDYGVGITPSATQGFVFGIGQYF